MVFVYFYTMQKLLLAAIVVFLCWGCSNTSSNKNALFQLQQNSGISFNNKLDETKDFNVFNYRNFYNGAGVATGDINNDGLVDVFFTSNQNNNKLFLNKGNLYAEQAGFAFEDVSKAAGFADKKQWSTGVTMVDINADGWLDIYICNAGNLFDSTLRRNQLFINNGASPSPEGEGRGEVTFTEQAAKYGLDNDGYSTHASFFDYDNDGDLDCFIVNNSPIPVNVLNQANNRDKPANEWDVPDFLRGGGDHLYKNDNGFFKEVTKEAGIHGSLISLGLGVTVSDVNEDGFLDIYVSNDFYERDYLYINQHNGTFKDELETSIQHTSLSSMGADIADVNNDGRQDIFTTDMLPSDEKRLKMNTSFENYDQFMIKYNSGFYHQYTQNALQVNIGKNKFLETAFYSGVAASDWSWGALLFDANNDGLNDIYVCNGIYRDVTDQDFIDFFANDIVAEMDKTGKKQDIQQLIDKMPSNPIVNSMFKNNGDLKFTNEAQDWGMSTPSYSNGAAYADLDNDGDLDLIVNNINQEAFVYKNTSDKNKTNYLKINLTYKGNNNFGIGTKCFLYTGKDILIREQIPARGFQSSIDYNLHFGLGETKPDSLKVVWPNGEYQVINSPAINQLLKVKYTGGKNYYTSSSNSSTFFIEDKVSFSKHDEDPFVDFNVERNIPFMLSRLGPKAAVADVNADGVEDIFIGGAKDQASQLYLQNGNGFILKPTPDFKTYAYNDVTAAVFFDADNDGDKDLLTGGGGNFAAENTPSYLSSLYFNDGKGNFALQRGAMPILNTNCGVIVPIDIDNDEALDLFVGSRSTPQVYGKTPPSYFLKNDGNGNFTDVTKTVAPQFANLGMITNAILVDVNKDAKYELVVVGEYMAPKIFAITNNKFTELANGLNDYLGWWQTVSNIDVDNDGDEDLILGNMGQNFYLQPTTQQPINIWMNDFDKNGTLDKVFSKTFANKDVPVFTKRELTDLLPGQKKFNLKHKDYANKTIQDLFGDDAKTATKLTVNYTSSAIAINDGAGNFTIKPLPYQAQLSSIKNAKVIDVNNDGYKDLVIAGNTFNMLPQFCRVDASFGQVLLNDKKRNFIPMPFNQAGLFISGEVNDLVLIKSQSKNKLLFLQNNDFPKLYTLQ
jgi:enediyne biosynthesis protein E4